MWLSLSPTVEYGLKMSLTGLALGPINLNLSLRPNRHAGCVQVDDASRGWPWRHLPRQDLTFIDI